MTEPVLIVEHLHKAFDSLQAVKDVSFRVNPGEIFGLLGPNGAGKTTTINMICSLLPADQGAITINNMPVSTHNSSLRQRMGVVPQDIALYEELNALDNLSFWGGLYGLSGEKLKSRQKELLSKVGLQDRAKEPVSRYSGGMKRRLNLAIGLLHDPDLLLLDEPTVGIDPQARHQMLDLIRAEANKGTAILYTTHYMDEAEQLCDRLAIMDHGQLLAMGSLSELETLVGERRILKIGGTFDQDWVNKLISTLSDVQLLTFDPAQITLSVPFDMAIGQILTVLQEQGLVVEHLDIKNPNLDSVFLKLTGREFKD
ncbi:ATP-binding cassette domain-containing protein [candidate division KSB1 bacterium]|nr:ATP-binding cassette domain-containing protein [candidate division KSB1 bacterium]